MTDDRLWDLRPPAQRIQQRTAPRATGRHIVLTTGSVGWAGLSNGLLLRRAAESFGVFVTVERSLEFQQNQSELRIAVVVLVAAIDVEVLRPLMAELLERLPSLRPGEIVRIGALRG
jgi:hypothetical protein